MSGADIYVEEKEFHNRKHVVFIILQVNNLRSINFMGADR